MEKIVISGDVLSGILPSKKEEDWGYKSFRIYNSLKSFGDVFILANDPILLKKIKRNPFLKGFPIIENIDTSDKVDFLELSLSATPVVSAIQIFKIKERCC